MYVKPFSEIEGITSKLFFCKIFLTPQLSGDNVGPPPEMDDTARMPHTTRQTSTKLEYKTTFNYNDYIKQYSTTAITYNNIQHSITYTKFFSD